VKQKHVYWALRMENGDLRPAFRDWTEGFPLCLYRTRREAKDDAFDGDKAVKVEVSVVARAAKE
jgi:hypothetical protein